MTYSTATDEVSGSSKWHGLTRALLGGLAVASAMFFHIAVVQTPGLDPPPETAALFLAAATAGTIGYLLLNQDSSLGYAAAMLTGAFVILSVVLVVLGVFGPAGSETNPLGPVTYVVLAAAVIITSGLSWRDRDATEPTADPSPASR